MTNVLVETKIYNPNGKIIYDSKLYNHSKHFSAFKEINIHYLKHISKMLKENISSKNPSNSSYEHRQELLKWKKKGYDLDNIERMNNFYGNWLGTFYVNGKMVGSVQADVEPSPK